MITGPRSGTVIRMFLEMASGPRHARELALAVGIGESRQVYPRLKYWIERGLVKKRPGIYGWLYQLAPYARELVRRIRAVMAELGGKDPVLEEVLMRLRRRGFRDRIYADVVRALYESVAAKGQKSPYVRAPTLEMLLLLLEELTGKRYSREEIREALEKLEMAGVIMISRPKPKSWLSGYALAFMPGFVRGLGVPAPAQR